MKDNVLKQQAYEKIKGKILSLELEPNQRVVEQELAQELGISRTPVREAIQQLAAEGFVKTIPQRGTYCLSLSIRQIRDILDIRMALEKLAVQRCISRGLSAGQLQELRELTGRFAACVEKNDLPHVNELDSAFHRKLAEFSGNKKLGEYLADIENYMVIARNMELMNKGMHKGALALADHRRLLQALEEGDEAAATKAIEQNIANMCANLGL